MPTDPLTITFPATVYKVSTLVDKALRVTLDLPEGCIEASALLMACQMRGIVLDVTATEAAGDAPAEAEPEARRVKRWNDKS
jgi:hypothetical protein